MFVKFAPKIRGGAALRIAESRRNGQKTSQKSVLYLGSGNTRAELEALLAEGEAVLDKLEEFKAQLSLPGLEPPKKRKRKKARLPKWLLKQLKSQEAKQGGKTGKRSSRRLPKRRQGKEEKAAAEAKAAERAREILEAKGLLDARRPPAVVLNDPLERWRSMQSFDDVLGAIYDRLGYSSMIQGGYKGDQWNEILRASVLARVFDPRSKRGTVRFLSGGCRLNIPLERIYRMMDHLHGSIERIKRAAMKNTLEIFPKAADVLFFDVTTLYFESFESDGFREPGFSKDNKVKETQVVLALAVNGEGQPLWYELFSGNTAETKTLAVCMQKLRSALSARRTVVVADRGMFSKSNFEFLESSGIDYVVAGRLKSLKKDQKERILASGLNESYLREKEREREKSGKKAKAGGKKKKEKKRKKEREERAENRETDNKEEKPRFMELNCENGRRMIVSWSKKRAQKDARDRQKKLDRLMKKAGGGQIPLSRLISNSGTKKYIRVKGKSRVVLDEERIREDERWDGFHGIVTNIKDQRAGRLLERYRGLWRVEAAFRANKHDLRMRPIFHWKKRRIEAHVAICFLAYSVSYTLKARLEGAGLSWSIERIREVLKEDQHIVLEDGKTGRRYKVFSPITPEIEAVYRAFQLKRVSRTEPLARRSG